MDEIHLMQVVEIIQEELHVPRLLSENQMALLFRDGVVMHQLRESAVRNRITSNIA
jgi:hypothetical protein